MKLRPVKWYQKLLTGKGRKREKRYLIEGPRQVEQFLESNPECIEEVLIIENFDFSSTAVPVRELSEPQMKTITDSETTPSIVAIAIIPDSINSLDLPDSLPKKILFLEDVQDPGNMGTLLRSAAAFRFDLVLMTSGCADPFAPKVVRSTAGALGSLLLRRHNDAMQLLAQLRHMNYQVVTADINGGVDTLSSVEKLIFALGNEGNGVSEKLLSLSDAVYTIPYDFNRVESLNVAVAGSIGMANSYQKDM